MTNTHRSPQLSFLAALVVIAVSAPALAVTAQPTPVTVRDAWVREPVASRKTTAAFLVIENAGTVKRAIVSATSEAAETVELHEMVRDGAMMKMSPVTAIDVPANGKTELKPGGLHIMMFGLKKQPVAGDTVRLTLTLDDGTKATVAALVRKMEGMK